MPRCGRSVGAFSKPLSAVDTTARNQPCRARRGDIWCTREVEPVPHQARPSAMRARIALLAAAVAALTACSGTGSVGAPSTPRPAATDTPSLPPGTLVRSLVGYRTQALTCPTKPTREPDRPSVVVTGQVRQYLICPMEPGGWGPPFSPHRLTPSAPRGGRTFARLDAALRLPDARASAQACPAMAQAPRAVLVETDEGRWRAHLPVDGCSLYLPQVLTALSEIDVAR